MDIWIIRDGEKAGPLPEYEIRSKIGTGDLNAETRAWHDGLPEWLPLGEISIFKNEFRPPEPPPLKSSPPPWKKASLPGAPPIEIPKNTTLFRRFWARWLDLSIYSAFWWFGIWVSGRDLGEVLTSPWVAISRFIPWFVLEVILLHRFASTPGKWLFGLSVTNDDGSKLSLAASSRRSLKVLVAGIGFGWPLMAIFCQVVSFFASKRLGKPLWDFMGGHRVVMTPLAIWKMAIVVVLFIGSAAVQVAVIAPYVKKNPPFGPAAAAPAR